MRNIHQLKFAIGGFCILSGVLLFGRGYGERYSGEWNLNKTLGWSQDFSAINLWCGAILFLVGMITIVFSFKDKSNKRFPPHK